MDMPHLISLLEIDLPFSLVLLNFFLPVNFHELHPDEGEDKYNGRNNQHFLDRIADKSRLLHSVVRKLSH